MALRWWNGLFGRHEHKASVAVMSENNEAGRYALLVTQVGNDGSPGGVIAAGENHIGAVGGHTAVAAASQFTRPGDTTPYSSGDLIANNTTAANVTPLQFTVARVAAGGGSIVRGRLKTDATTWGAGAIRLHLYRALPTVTNGDNGGWLSNKAGDYLGSLSGTFKAFSDGCMAILAPDEGAYINFKPASGQLVYGLVEARAALTPTNGQTFDVSLEVQQD